MIFPKKPQLLYAPMLATFGGGTANGFKASGGVTGIPLTSSLTMHNGQARGNGPSGPSANDLPYNISNRSDLSDLNFSVSNGIQSFDVPATGDYSYIIAGASSVRQIYASSGPQYGASYGRAATFSGTLTISSADQGKRIFVACGNLPASAGGYSTSYAGQQHSTGDCFNGAGGGTFVGIGTTLSTCTPLLVAGGGGSQRTTYSYNQSELNARTDFVANGNTGGGATGSATDNGQPNIGGINGYGGYAFAQNDQGTAGAGFYGNADVESGFASGGRISTNYYTASAKSFINGATGCIAYNVGSSNPQPSGGFGGGGAGGWGGSGGGGGYSGGGSGTNNGSYGYGGGGSNFRDSTKCTASTPTANRSGPGYLTLTYLG